MGGRTMRGIPERLKCNSYLLKKQAGMRQGKVCLQATLPELTSSP
jgi:hypothetical protein